MSGDTHAAVGAATAGIVVSSLGPVIGVTGSREFLIEAVIVGAVGALFPDLDSKKSKGNQILNNVLILVIPLILALMVLQYFAVIKLSADFVDPTQVAGGVGLLVMAMYMRSCPHREFSHSLAACAATTVLVCLFGNNSWWIWFGLGFLSHLAIDYLNEKGESLLWPMPGKYCLHLCSASGVVNKVMRYTALLVLAVVVVVRFGGVR